jgi:hypothetical protein
MKTQPANFTLSGDGLCVGYDSGDAVSQEYKSPGKFKGGTIFGVGGHRRENPVLRPREGSGTNDEGAIVRAFNAAGRRGEINELK